MLTLKKIGGVAFALIFLFSATALAAEFWGSKKSNKYHFPSCQWAQKIKPYNLVTFASPEAAVQAGYVPCKVCRPPISSRSETTRDERSLLVRAYANDDLERSGCCSWHGGWCGYCDSWTGKYICCDGILSPTCYCR